MKKILMCICVLMCSLTVFAQHQDPFNTTSIGIGYSHMDEDGYKDNNIDLWMTVYGVYFDVAIGTSLKDYDYNSDMSSYTIDVGYEIPIIANDDVKVLVGPAIGVTNVGYDDYYGGYGYYDNYFETVNSYFNYGVVGGIVVNNLHINAKVTKTNIGIGIGYNF